jgi:RNA polymerase sigma-70 factor, ECF subfamily
MADESGQDAPSPLEATEVQGRVQRAIDLLPEAQKQIVLMRYYANMKFTEIAEALGCPLNTALGRMHKATLKLREMLGES